MHRNQENRPADDECSGRVDCRCVHAITARPSTTVFAVARNLRDAAYRFLVAAVVEQLPGRQHTRTGGSMRVPLVGFAWFVVITGVTRNGQKVTVAGEVVGLEAADPDATLGGWNHLPDGATSVGRPAPGRGRCAR
jgi:hypothetical protein